MTIKPGLYKSNTCDLVAVVERVDDVNVWYSIPQFRGLVPCCKQLFGDSMHSLVIVPREELTIYFDEEFTLVG